MKHPEDKGSFSTNIGDDVLQEALKAVEKRTGETSTEAAAPAVEISVETPAAPPADPRDKEIEELKQQLEFSSGKGRELMAKLKDEGRETDAYPLGRKLLQAAKFDYVVMFVVIADMVIKPGPADIATLLVLAAILLGGGLLFLGGVWCAAAGEGGVQLVDPGVRRADEIGDVAGYPVGGEPVGYELQ